MTAAAIRDVTDRKVETAGSLAEALQKVDEAGGFDLLVTDYHLARGETGLEVIAAFRERLQANLKAVLVTGDTSTAIKELPPDPNLRVASKPIRAEELLNLMRALLAGGS